MALFPPSSCSNSNRNNHQPQNLLSSLLLLLLLLLSAPAQSQQETATAAATAATPLLYHLLSSEEIHTTLLQWQADFPHLISVYTSQDEFDLPTAGDWNDCPFDSDVKGCLNYFAVIQDKVAHPLGSPSSNRLPTVLLSGELHGNERVGPTAVMETSRLLLEAATCEALPTHPSLHLNQTRWEQEVQQAIECRTVLESKYGMSPAQRQWLARLVATRRVLVVPTANALGYYQDVREENGVDPNRDFPYDLLDPTICMQSIAARTLNELFRHYLIMTSFTFHGGTELLGYEWGNPSWLGYVSPDDVAQDRLAQAFSSYGGSFSSSATGQYVPEYLYGDMNSIIYYVRGGFEDYAYAGSWDTDRMPICTPDTYGGYPAEQTTYDDGMLRAFNMLVETSQRKTPFDNDLGTSFQVLFENNEAPEPTTTTTSRNPNGHVARNIRLSMGAIDLVQPYLNIHQINDLVLQDDILPLQPQPQQVHANDIDKYCSDSTTFDKLSFVQDISTTTSLLPVVSTSPDPDVTLHWTVGGSIEVDQTMLWVAVLDPSSTSTSGVNAPEGTAWLHQYYCANNNNNNNNNMANSHRLDPNNIQQYFTPLTASQQSGDGFFSVYGSRPASGDDPYFMGPVFETTLDLQQLGITATETTQLLIVASARVDNSWTQSPTDGRVGPANTGPQSHMVHSRTNDQWYHTNAQQHVIQGQSEWFSEPILLEIRMDTQGDGTGTSRLVNDRFQFPVPPTEEEVESEPSTLAPTTTVTTTTTPMTMMPSMKDTSTNDPTLEPSTVDVDMATTAPSFVSSTEAPATSSTSSTGEGVSFILKDRKEAPPPKFMSLATISTEDNDEYGGQAASQNKEDCDSSSNGGARLRRKRALVVEDGIDVVVDTSKDSRRLQQPNQKRIQEQRQRQAANNKRRLGKLRGEMNRNLRP